MKNKWLISFLLILIVLISFRGFRYYDEVSNLKSRHEQEKTYTQTVEKYSIQSKNDKEESIPEQINGVIGKIEIPSIDLSYVILEKTTDKNLDISITKVVGPSLNQKGNLVLAGHNMDNGDLFGRLADVELSDSIILYDLAGRPQEYKIYETKIVNETDLSPLNQDEMNSELVTLITCTDVNHERFIVYAKKA